MFNSVMHQLTYSHTPVYSRYSQYREYLRKASHYSCAYCTITESENPGATFNIDHYRPKTLFPLIASSCTNLRYLCPRCNSYKSNRWISVEDGCTRNCEKCERKVCKNNIDRFIDVLNEDPSTMLYLGEDNKLYAFSGSKPADYTIKYLRLNREQLIQLRHIRSFMDGWKKDLLMQKKDAETKLAKIKEEHSCFLSQSTSTSTHKEQLCLDAIGKMFDLLTLTAEQSLSCINEEITRLDKLIAYHICENSIIEG